MKTECGVIGILLNKNVSTSSDNEQITEIDIYNTMNEIQHRGQDSYGYVILSASSSIVSSSRSVMFLDVPVIKEIRNLGLLPGIEELELELPQTGIFLGHMRYSTNTIIEIKNTDTDSGYSNIQPIEISAKNGIYLSHNGNLPNLIENIKRLGLDIKDYKDGMSDTWLFKIIWNQLYGVIKPNNNNVEVVLDDVLGYIKYIIDNIPGAYSCVITFCDNTTNNNYIFGFRDRFGYKPLSIGKLYNNYCFFSESVQLSGHSEHSIYINDVAPGEVWMSSTVDMQLECVYSFHNIQSNKLKNVNMGSSSGNLLMCSLEILYFMKRDSILFNGNTTVNNFRQAIGFEMAKRDASINIINTNNGKDILFLPESAYSMAYGYSLYNGNDSGNDSGNNNGNCQKRLRVDLIKKIENVRSFIESTNEAREGKLKRKFAFDDVGIAELKGEIVLIDDTIVRGNSIRYIVGELFKRNKNIKIHVRIGSPPLVRGCSFGIDLYDDELIVCKEKDLVAYLGNGVVSVEFLDIDTLKRLFEKYNMGNCGYCFGVNNELNNKTLEW